MRWPKIEEIYGSALRATPVFDPLDEAGGRRWAELHNRVIEHNIRVVAKYYTRITSERLTQLLDLNEKVRSDRYFMLFDNLHKFVICYCIGQHALGNLF